LKRTECRIDQLPFSLLFLAVRASFGRTTRLNDKIVVLKYILRPCCKAPPKKMRTFR